MSYDSSAEYKKIEKKYFTLVKDLTILTGTIFGSSIALSVGREVNFRFIIGELLLFVSLSAGIINLYANIKASEGIHFLFTINELKSTLPKKTGGAEDFFADAQNDLIKDYKKLYAENQRDPLIYLLKIIKIDYFYPILVISLITGVFFILISIIDFSNITL